MKADSNCLLQYIYQCANWTSKCWADWSLILGRVYSLIGPSCLGPRFYWSEMSDPSYLWAELSCSRQKMVLGRKDPVPPNTPDFPQTSLIKKKQHPVCNFFFNLELKNWLTKISLFSQHFWDGLTIYAKVSRVLFIKPGEGLSIWHHQ